MSTLWTPDGERRVETRPQSDIITGSDPNGRGPEPSRREVADAEAQMEALRAEILNSKVEDVVANHCYGLFELAALYLSATPPRLKDATIAIDALSGLVEAVSNRLGAAEAEIKDAVSQLRLAFVQISVIQEPEQS